MSNLINKVKEKAIDALQSDKRENPSSDNSGPHGSNIMNKMDPRVDSDRDNRDDPTSRVGGYGDDRQFVGNTEDYNRTGNTMGGGNQYDNPRSDNAGPHSSNLMNKADPRVDSDRDGRNDPNSRIGGYGDTQDNFGAGGPGGAGYGGDTYGTTTGASGYGGNTGGVGGGQYDDPRSTNTGPHSSNLMNKADPRIDSDRDGRNDPDSRVGGYGDTQQGYGSGGGFADSSVPGTQHGHHGHHGHHQQTPGSGDATRTAGPHDSDMMNKMDPRVDSDMDGSRTYGGDRTNY